MFDWTALAPLLVKGKRDPVAVYSAQQATNTPKPIDIAAAHPLLGRTAEISRSWMFWELPPMAVGRSSPYAARPVLVNRVCWPRSPARTGELSDLSAAPANRMAAATRPGARSGKHFSASTRRPMARRGGRRWNASSPGWRPHLAAACAAAGAAAPGTDPRQRFDPHARPAATRPAAEIAAGGMRARRGAAWAAPDRAGRLPLDRSALTRAAGADRAQYRRSCRWLLLLAARPHADGDDPLAWLDQLDHARSRAIERTA